jgi:surfeit locus 1 family protein
MLSRLRSAGVLWAAIAMIPALILLFGLGTWQMQRKSWKDALVTRIDARITAPPVTIEEAERQRRATGDIEYLRVRASGRFLNDQERYFYAPDQRLGPGYHVYTPLVVREAAGCRDVVWVNRGFVTDAVKSPENRRAGQIEGETAVVGLVRLPQEAGLFTPSNDAKRNLWFWRDLPALWASLGAQEIPCSLGAAPYLFTIDAQAEPANPGGWPKGGTTIVSIPNRHLEYALTWYGLALTLLGVYAAYAWGRLKETGG